MCKSQTISFHTIGCKLNFSETSFISQKFVDAGFIKVNFNEKAEIYVINTCAVTSHAEKKCREAIRKAKRKNPKAIIAVIGCYSQLKAEEITKIKGVDLILGSNEKYKLYEHIDARFKSKIPCPKPQETGLVEPKIVIDDSENQSEFIPSYSFGDRTRCFLKVQDGCDYFCSYCTIPLARGKSRSAAVINVVENVKKIALQDVKEIVLTGVNLGDFGKGNLVPQNAGNETLLQLITALEKVHRIERFRLSSIEPDLLNDSIIEFIAKSEKFMPHFHIPLQSASDKILNAMKRKYKVELFNDRINKINTFISDCFIGVDVMVGFPTETDRDFAETYDFLKNLQVSFIHVFSFSARENTFAAKMKEQVEPKIIHHRSEILRKLGAEKKLSFYKRNLGTQAKVLFESKNYKGFITGFTENYIKVKVPFNKDLINKIIVVKLEKIDEDGIVIGRI